jgi:hypothetical protein
MPDKVTTRTLIRWKQEGRRIVSVTAYDYPTARLADEVGIDVVLVGDSVGNTMLGYATTLPVTLDEMEHHLRAVRRGIQRALLVVDMPFLTYGVSVPDAVYNAGRLMQAGAEAVKLEGATEPVLQSIRAMVDIGIPVMAHLGLTPPIHSQVWGLSGARTHRASGGGVISGSAGGAGSRRVQPRVGAYPHRTRTAHHRKPHYPHHRHRRRTPLRWANPSPPRHHRAERTDL